MAITVDLAYIEEKGLERERENLEFRSFLKQHDLPSSEIDAIVHEIVDEVTAQIDCTQCANCCKQIRPVLDEEDISRFALGLKVPVIEFQEQYLSVDDEEPSKYNFKELPCPFLENDRCSNYDHRPETCSSYPHLHKKDFVSRLFGVIENYGLCPIVFNVYEQLKDELWHHDWIDEDDFEIDWW